MTDDVTSQVHNEIVSYEVSMIIGYLMKIAYAAGKEGADLQFVVENTDFVQKEIVKIIDLVATRIGEAMAEEELKSFTPKRKWWGR